MKLISRSKKLVDTPVRVSCDQIVLNASIQACAARLPTFQLTFNPRSLTSLHSANYQLRERDRPNPANIHISSRRSIRTIHGLIVFSLDEGIKLPLRA